MAMKHCPDCGENYSDTYRRCPFCAEEAAGTDGRRRGGHRAANNGPSVLSSLLVIVIVLLGLILVGLLFGDSIREALGGSGKTEKPAASSAVVSAVKPSVSEEQQPDSSAEPEPQPQPSTPDPVDINALPEKLKLSSSDFTMSVGDTPVKLTVSGASGTCVWTSEDEGIASVDADGTVVAISAGSVKIIASDGSAKGTCIVRVKGSGVPNAGSTAAGDAKLNREDFTLKKGETFQLQLTGVNGQVNWSSSDTSVASVSSTGAVTGVGQGNATITASWGNGSVSCIARVK